MNDRSHRACQIIGFDRRNPIRSVVRNMEVVQKTGNAGG